MILTVFCPDEALQGCYVICLLAVYEENGFEDALTGFGSIRFRKVILKEVAYEEHVG